MTGFFCSAHTHSAHKRSSAINVQEPKRLVALMLISEQPCVGREKVEIINFREIKNGKKLKSDQFSGK